MYKKNLIILIIIFSLPIRPIFLANAKDPIDLGITEYRAKVNSTYARGDSWSVKYENGVYKWSSEPIWVWDGSNYISYIFDNQYNTKGYYQVQSGLIAARIYDYYAEFYTPDMSELRLYDERWEIQQWTGKKWSDIGAQSGTPNFSISADANNINITKSYTSWAGKLEIIYIFKEGKPMKHEIRFNSTLSELTTFKPIQKWVGIVGTKVNDETINTTTPVNETHLKFKKIDGTLSIIEDQYNAIEKYEYAIIDIHPSGLKANFIFSNWTLSYGESIIIDPDTSTKYTIKDSYVRSYNPENNYGSSTFLRVKSGEGDNERILVGGFNLSAIQGSLISAKLYLYCYESTSANGRTYHFHKITGTWEEMEVNWYNQPSVGSSYESYYYPGSTGWWEVHVTNITELGQIMEYRLKDSVESAGGYDRYVNFYSREYDGKDPYLYIEYSLGAPNSPNLISPSNGARFNMGSTLNFTWIFSDPNQGDNQTGYQIQLDNNPTFSSPEVDSGYIASENWWTLQNLPNFVDEFYWQVRNWDEENNTGDWSSSRIVVSERWKLTDLWASKENPLVNESVYLYAKGCLESDGHQPDSDDSLIIEGVDFSWDWVEERFFASVTKNSSGSITYDELTSVYEDTYNITEGTMNGKSITVNWGSSQYNFYGLYLENGTLKGSVNVTAYFTEGSEEFEVNGSKTKQFETQPIMFTYPLTGGGTRCIYTSSTNETYYLFEPNIDYSSYSFTIKDYSGKIGQQNSYLESLININTTERLVERKLIWDTENPTTLVFMDSQVYIIQITSEAKSY